jgi:glycosyltransferase involved in cell wall biosynthesis
MNPRYCFTVFTPAYNRAPTLPRVYESLKAQTFRDFEWLIVDDGSTDNTPELVEKWRAEANFPIRYFYQPNQGKPAAFNRGVREAAGELFLTLDSDDSCFPHALSRLKYYWEDIPAQQRAQFSAVTALCRDQNGRLSGKKFPRDVTDSDSVEMYLKGRMTGEKWGFQRTDALREFPFPVIPNQKFVPESIVWMALSRKYRTRFVNEVLRIYNIRDGASDHLSYLRKDVLWGRAFFYKFVLNDFLGWVLKAPLGMFRSAVQFSRYSFDLGKDPISQLKELNSFLARVLVCSSLPVGFVMCLRDRRFLRDTAPT